MLDFHDTERDVFKRMEHQDQSMALFDMMRSVRGEIAATKRAILDMQEDVTKYRRVREIKESNTEQKIESILAKRFDFWAYFRDKIIPPILTMIIIALLYLAFQNP